MTRRRNGEGSIYPVKDGYRGYVWCTNPAGERYRKYVKGKTYEDTRAVWLKLRDAASRGPVASDVPSLESFISYWLDEIVRPNLAPKTCEKYELFSRKYSEIVWLLKVSVQVRPWMSGRAPQDFRIVTFHPPPPGHPGPPKA